ncbi:MAG: hypothetical protein J4478_01375 [Candidatus Diapherotrites archaeon]|uniref:Uncharacterized protein n=1 Tax=Candidatus Iainarchaeum sp. TaxID=3101447 RepID=A0A8T4KVM7_9ARCH|nr:hypothetical protein [Candidatus Diapherotrites archaeon]
MKFRKEFAFLLFLLLPLAASAIVNPSEFKGDITVSLEKNSLNAGETLNASITALNMEAIPIAEGVFIIELVKGGESYYPTQFSNADNIFLEQKIEGVNLRPLESRTFNFSYKLPSDLAQGSYRLDAYFRTERSPIVGITHILMNPKSAQFAVKNSSASAQFPQASVVRTKTVFNDAENIQTLVGEEPEGLGPVGPPVKPGAEISGKVFVQNVSSAELKDLEVSARLCEWDDSLCTKWLSEASATISSIKAGSEASVDLSLKAPEKPNAYAIRLEVKKDGKLLSLYRNRAVVIGAGARIRKLVSKRVELEKGKEAGFSLLISPSADHYLNPEFKDFSLRLSVQDLNSGQTLYSKTEEVPLIDFQINFIEKNYSFIPSGNVLKYKVCASLEKQSSVIDSYCTVYDSENFSESKSQELETSWERKQSNALLELKFCAIPEGKSVKANFQLLSNDLQEFIAGENFEGTGCVEKKIQVDAKKEFKLAVTDYITGIQKTYDIGLQEVKVPGAEETGSIDVISGISPDALLLAIAIVLTAVIALVVVTALKLVQKRGRRK